MWRDRLARLPKLVVALTLAVLGLGITNSAAAEVVPALVGENLLTADHTVGTHVDIPDGAHFMPDRDLQLGGSVRFGALLLVGPTFRAFAWLERFCEQSQCSLDGHDSQAWAFPIRSDGTADVPAGRYSLYLIASGGSLTARLRLPSLGGTRSLVPSGPADVSLVEPPSSLPAGSNSAYLGGATLDAPVGAFFFDGIAARGTMAPPGDIGVCFYPQGPPSEAAYGPTCPGGGYGSSFVVVSAGAGEGWVSNAALGSVYAAGPYAAGRWGLGGHFAAPAVLSDLVSVAMVARFG